MTPTTLTTETEKTPTDRFDMPAVMREFLKRAVTLGVIDAANMWALTINHGSDFAAIRDEIMQYAFSWIHVDARRHDEMCIINAECYRVMVLGLKPTIVC